MTTQELEDLLKAGDISKLRSTLETHYLVKGVADAFKQYDPKYHDIMSPENRKPIPIYDTEGKGVTDWVQLAKIPLALQKKIVLTAAMFLGNPKFQSTANGPEEDKMTAGIDRIMEDNKMEYKFTEVVERAMSEKHSALLSYTQAADPDYWEGTGIKSSNKIRMRILSPVLGDLLYPVYDDYGDMIAFGRGYKIKRPEKEVEYFDIYTADRFYYSSNESGAWTTEIFMGDPALKITGDNLIGVPNPVGKIPVIYFPHHLEWEDVQELIDRLEIIISNHADTNDYVGSPIVFAEGDTLSFPKKGQAGKFIQGNNGAKVSYLTYDAQPGSVKMEIENLMRYIYSLTHTPDISFEQMKGLGVFSGVALKMLFMDAHLKAAHNERVFGEGAQRMVNYHKAALASLDKTLKPAVKMRIKPVFTYFLPENFTEEIDNINKGLNGGILSQQTAVKLNPLVNNPEEELVTIKAETTVNDQKALDLAQASKPSLLPEPANN